MRVLFWSSRGEKKVSQSHFRLVTSLTHFYSIRIKRLPPILAIHLKRFAHNENYRAIKLFYRVNHPTTLIPPNTTDNCENPDQIYDLVAIMVHIGKYVKLSNFIMDTLLLTFQT